MEILDFYHVCEHLTRVAMARFGAGTVDGKKWVQRMKEELLTRGPCALLESLAGWVPATEAAAEVRRQEEGYFWNNRERMRYPLYLAAGFPIGSGTVEKACKHLVGAQFKQVGMRWKLDTGEPLLHLLAAVLTQPDIDLRAYVS